MIEPFDISAFPFAEECKSSLFYENFCTFVSKTTYRSRPIVADAARVLEIDTDKVVKVLVSAGYLSSKQIEWSDEISGILLDERAVAYLKKYNRKKLIRYYHTASKAVKSMSEEEKRTFDNFIKLYTNPVKSRSGYKSRSTSKPKIDQRKIDKAFLRELFQSQADVLIYALGPSEPAVLSAVRNSIYYHITVSEASSYDFIPGILPEWIKSMVALRYHIFSTEDDSDDYSSSVISYLC